MRRSELKRKTPLKAGTKGLSRGKGLQRGDKHLARGKGLNARSERTIFLQPVRAATVAVVRQRGGCEVIGLLEDFAAINRADKLAAIAEEGGIDPERDLRHLDEHLDGQRCHRDRASVVHEPGARSRDIGSQYDPERAVLICEPCHSLAHLHPALARAVGATL